MWGLLAFALNYIPNIGSVLAAIPPILQVLVFGGLYEALVVLAGYLVINLVFGNILEPRIMGRGLGLSTLVVFLSLIFWGWLLGPVGMLLSVPLTIIVKIALEQTVAGQSIAFLLSDLSKNLPLREPAARTCPGRDAAEDPGYRALPAPAEREPLNFPEAMLASVRATGPQTPLTCSPAKRSASREAAPMPQPGTSPARRPIIRNHY
jgi:hypothetical protein